MSNHEPGWIRRTRGSAAQRAGRAYERAVLAHFSQDPKFTPGPWIVFWTETSSKPRWCQPDGLFIDLRRGEITIVEVKLRHCQAAYWQLEGLYRPVVAALFGNDWTYRLCEVAKHYDAAVSFPGQMVRIDNPLNAPDAGIGICVWRGDD